VGISVSASHRIVLVWKHGAISCYQWDQQKRIVWLVKKSALSTCSQSSEVAVDKFVCTAFPSDYQTIIRWDEDRLNGGITKYNFQYITVVDAGIRKREDMRTHETLSVSFMDTDHAWRVMYDSRDASFRIVTHRSPAIKHEFGSLPDEGVVTCIHLTKSRYILVGFDTGVVVIYSIPPEAEHTNAARMIDYGWKNPICIMRTGFSGVKAIYSENRSREDGGRIAILASHGFLQVYDQIEEVDKESGMYGYRLELVRSMDLAEIRRTVNPPSDAAGIKWRQTFSRESPRMVTVKLDSQRLVYHEVMTGILCTWSFGPPPPLPPPRIKK
jgi:hypothetical protein